MWTLTCPPLWDLEKGPRINTALLKGLSSQGHSCRFLSDLIYIPLLDRRSEDGRTRARLYEGRRINVRFYTLTRRAADPAVQEAAVEESNGPTAQRQLGEPLCSVRWGSPRRERQQRLQSAAQRKQRRTRGREGEKERHGLTSRPR